MPINGPAGGEGGNQAQKHTVGNSKPSKKAQYLQNGVIEPVVEVRGPAEGVGSPLLVARWQEDLMRGKDLVAERGVSLQAEDGAEDGEEEQEAAEVDVVPHLLLHGAHAMEQL